MKKKFEELFTKYFENADMNQVCLNWKDWQDLYGEDGD